LDCAALAPLLPAYTDGELDAAQSADVAAHLAACPACRERRAREDAFTAFMRTRLGSAEAAPASLRAAIAAAAAAARRGPWWARPLASPWAPRLAAAAVLALVIAVPLAWLPNRTTGQAQAAFDRHRTHALVPGSPTLPACCTAVAAGVGDRLGPPSPGAVVPDLGPAGLRLAGVTYCTFSPHPVHLLAWRDRRETRFSLYITDRSLREFKLLRARARDGVVQAREEVATTSGRFEVCTWMQGGLVYTWVGPVGDAAGAAALAALLLAAR
jgi:anti-sigma factor RsiW